jgi:hypothetical protein
MRRRLRPDLHGAATSAPPKGVRLAMQETFRYIINRARADIAPFPAFLVCLEKISPAGDPNRRGCCIHAASVDGTPSAAKRRMEATSTLRALPILIDLTAPLRISAAIVVLPTPSILAPTFGGTEIISISDGASFGAGILAAVPTNESSRLRAKTRDLSRHFECSLGTFEMTYSITT